MSSSNTGPRTIRMALLICGHLSGPVYAANGDYHQVYKRFLNNSLPSNANATFVLDPYDVVQKMEYPEADKLTTYDGVVLTGSAASAYENLEWINRLVAWVQNISKEYPKIKIIGICFGHQIVSRALGGKCVPNEGRWEIGPTPVQLTDVGKSIFGVDQMNLQEMHRDHVPVESLPGLTTGEIHLLGSTSISANQGFVEFYPSSLSSDRSPEQIHILTVQGHPEFTESIVTGIVRQRSASGVIDAAAAESYFGKGGDEGDNEPIMKDQTGRRWWKDDGIGIFGNVFWRMFGVGVAA